MKNKNLSNHFKEPILLLAFNRPKLTQRIFNEIRNVKPKQLFVAVDGPRKNVARDPEKCDQVKAIVKNVDWDCDLHTLFRSNNLGCKNAVSEAIDWFFKHVDRGIILEDDCLPNTDFFFFCKKMLSLYEKDERIMMISGTNYMIEHPYISSDYFFSKHFTVWGWATWRRAWEHYDVNITDWKRRRKTKQLKYLLNNFYLEKYYENFFNSILNNTIDTWDVQWVYACLFNSGLSVIPRVNLISNIGIEGTHVKKITSSHFYQRRSLNLKRLKHPKYVTPDAYFDNRLVKDKIRKSVIRQQLLGWIKSLIRQKNT